MSKATESVQKARIANYNGLIKSIKQQIEECDPIYVNSRKFLNGQLKRAKQELKQIKKLGF